MAEFVSLSGRGWPSPVEGVALIRLRDRPGFAVGVQPAWRSGGTGRVWRSLTAARRRAAVLARLHKLPIAEAI